MAREFQRGHKAKISDLTAGTDLYVGVQISGPGLSFDISCFGLDADERLSDDRYFIFFNQPKSPEESIQLLGTQSGDTESFRVTLDRIPPGIQKLSFTATIDGNGQMSQIAPGYVRIVAGGEEVARYPFDGSEFSTERAVMLGDFYLKDVWRFAAVGQGFDGGLDALLKNFGGEVAEEEPAAAPQQPQADAAGEPGPGEQQDEGEGAHGDRGGVQAGQLGGEGADVGADRALRGAAEDDVELGDGDGDADAGEHAVHDRGADGECRAGHAQVGQSQLGEAGEDGDGAGGAPAVLVDEVGGDDGETGRRAADLEGGAAQAPGDEAADGGGDEAGLEWGVGGEGDAQGQGEGDQEDRDGGRQIGGRDTEPAARSFRGAVRSVITLRPVRVRAGGVGGDAGGHVLPSPPGLRGRVGRGRGARRSAAGFLNAQ